MLQPECCMTMLYTIIYDDGRLGWACAGSFPARLPRPGAAYPLPPWMLLVMLSRIYSSPDKAMASPSSAESPSPKVWSAQFIVNFSQTVHVSGDDVVAEYKRERSLVVRILPLNSEPPAVLTHIKALLPQLQGFWMPPPVASHPT